MMDGAMMGAATTSRPVAANKGLLTDAGRKPGRNGLKLAGLCLAMALAACQSSGLGLEGNRVEAQNTAPVLTPNPAGEVFGQGQVRVALLVPKTAPGNGATVANEIRNGALLAMQDFGKSTIQIVIKDTAGQAASAQSAANEAVL